MSQLVIVAGLLKPLVNKASELIEAGRVLLIEDPSLADRAARMLAGDPKVSVDPWRYSESATSDAWYHLHRHEPVVAVIPGVEYALPFAARLAERFGVPGASLGAAQLLRDKSLLRTAASAAGIANPAFAAAPSLAAALEFAQAHPGPLVVKPTNRQGSVGTIVVPAVEALEQAWARAQVQEEAPFVAYQSLPLRMQIEQYIEGIEYSVETLVSRGRTGFANVTGKLLFEGDRPIERGHVVPADAPVHIRALLIEATELFTDVIGFQTGVLHCEWIVKGDTPYLVECTGRLPGDGIVALIEHAWQIDLMRDYLLTMMGRPTEPAPQRPGQAAAVYFPAVAPGVVQAVTGLDEAAAVPRVYMSGCLVKPGERVHKLRSSWDRVVGAAATGPTPAQALATAREAAERIVVRTVPD